MFVVHAGATYYPVEAGAPESDFVGTYNSKSDAIASAERAYASLSKTFGGYAWATVAVFPQPDEDAGVRTVFSLGL